MSVGDLTGILESILDMLYWASAGSDMPLNEPSTTGLNVCSERGPLSAERTGKAGSDSSESMGVQDRNGDWTNVLEVQVAGEVEAGKTELDAVTLASCSALATWPLLSDSPDLEDGGRGGKSLVPLSPIPTERRDGF